MDCFVRRNLVYYACELKVPCISLYVSSADVGQMEDRIYIWDPPSQSERLLRALSKYTNVRQSHF